jgi:hypothetical protein
MRPANPTASIQAAPLQLGESEFNEIYAAAVANKGGIPVIRDSSETKLQKLKTQYGTLDIEFKEETPAIRLAKEGKLEALNLLLKVGINTDQLLSYFIENGNRAMVNSILDMITKMHGPIVNLNAMIREYAGQNNQTAVEALLACGANINWAARGFAEQNHVKEAKALKEIGASSKWIIRGLAKVGNVPAVRECLDDVKDDLDQYYTLLVWATHGYAENGHLEEIEKILTEISVEIDSKASEGPDIGIKEKLEELKQSLIQAAAHGNAEGGEIAYEIFNTPITSDAIESGLALGNHREKIESLIQSCPQHHLKIRGHAALGLTQAGYFPKFFKNNLQDTALRYNTMDISGVGDSPDDVVSKIKPFINSVVEGGHYHLLKYIEKSVVLPSETQWNIAEKLAKSGHIVESAKWIVAHNLALDYLTPQHKDLLKHPAALRTLLVFNLAQQQNDELKKATVASFMAHELLPQRDTKQSEDIVFNSQEILSLVTSGPLTVEQAIFHDAAKFLAVADMLSSPNDEFSRDLQDLIASHLVYDPLLVEDPSSTNVNGQREELMRRGQLSAPHFFLRSGTNNAANVDTKEEELCHESPTSDTTTTASPTG